jgi:hypothetical protein
VLSYRWYDLGSFLLGRGAQLVLSNDNAPTGVDVGYDVVAFIPTNAAPRSAEY